MRVAPAISIIVPVYNMEKYLVQALDSLISQSIRELEIIIVNDGSVDASGEIIDRYARMDNRIIVVNQDNAGLSAARNSALAVATGKYVAFFDSDDWVEPDMYDTLYRAAELEDCDYVFCNHFKDFEQSGEVRRSASRYETGLYATREEFRNQILFHLIIRGEGEAVVWNGLYKRELIESHSLRFGQHLILEDYVFNMQYLHLVRSARFVDAPLYHYRIRAHSLSRTLHDGLFANLVEVHEMKEKLIDQSELKGKSDHIEDAKWFISLARNYIYLEYMFNDPKRPKRKLRKISETVHHEKTRKLLRRVLQAKQRNFFNVAAYIKAVPLIAAAAAAIGLAYRTKKRLRF
ncbi:glycosyltransferase [Cohnella yongneupensis]|uniref:Glycosyltransferase n=1 Tax=Cohnella yongneupensis TaxID=425006 RepID=A0ABW0R3D3_9BACL